MATPSSVLISPDEYLRTSYEGPDREYVDGEVIERSTPTYQHGEIQSILAMLFADLFRQKLVFVSSEVRMELDPLRLYRIPDFCAYEGTRPAGPYPTVPPMLAVEISSPDDRLTQTLEKFEEYSQWGVAHIWLVNPEKKRLYTYDSTGLHPVSVLSLPKYSIHITLADLALT